MTTYEMIKERGGKRYTLSSETELGKCEDRNNEVEY